MTRIVFRENLWRGGLPGNASSANSKNLGTGPFDWLACDVPADAQCDCVQCNGKYTHEQHLLVWRNTLACRYRGINAVNVANGWNMQVSSELPFPKDWGVVAGWTSILNDNPSWRLSADGYNLMSHSVLSHVEGHRWRCPTPKPTCQKWEYCGDCANGKWQIGRGIGWDCVRVRPRELGGEDGYKCVRRVAHDGFYDAAQPDQTLHPDPRAPLYRGRSAVLLRTRTVQGQKAEVFRALESPLRGTNCTLSVIFYPASEDFCQHFELRANISKNIIFAFDATGCALRPFGDENEQVRINTALRGAWHKATIRAERQDLESPWQASFSLFKEAVVGWANVFDIKSVPTGHSADSAFIGFGLGVERRSGEFGTVYWNRVIVQETHAFLKRDIP